jgi:hypothetical protein
MGLSQSVGHQNGRAVAWKALYEGSPFFFTRNGGPLSLVGIYRGGHAFLIGAGPSFAAVDKERLRSVWTMTLNNAVSAWRGNAACAVDDPSRFNYSMWLDPTIQKFVPLSSLEKPLWDNRMLMTPRGLRQQWRPADLRVEDCPNVAAFRRNDHFDASRFLYEETINWGCSAKLGGGRSVMLPALRILFLLGFRRVYLLGVDFEMTREKKYHFPEDRPDPAIRANMDTYDKLRRWFAELQPYFLEEDFVVQNCNPTSRLDVFPFISLDDATRDATASLGDPAGERTLGMYRKLDEKVREVARHDRGEREPNRIGTSATSPEEGAEVRYLVLRNLQAPGDIVMLTAAVRDLHKSNPGLFHTDVRTSSPEFWENNPHITSLDEEEPWVTTIDCDYPLIHRSNTEPWHFIHGFIQFLSQKLEVPIRPTAFMGDIHLSPQERASISPVQQIVGTPTPFWLIVAGGKLDYTIKWWSHSRFQEVVNHFRDKILFVQVGEEGHEHPPLEGVLDLRGKTDLRQLVNLTYHSQGVLCPVTLLMHLAAAVETRPGMPRNRACVVVAGGREPSQWEAYPHHQFLHTNGALPCCDNGGCWKSRTVPLGDEDRKDRPENLCVDVVPESANAGVSGKCDTKRDSRRNALAFPQAVWPNLMPRCMEMITVDQVIRSIELYFSGEALRYLSAKEAKLCQSAIGKSEPQ